MIFIIFILSNYLYIYAVLSCPVKSGIPVCKGEQTRRKKVSKKADMGDKTGVPRGHDGPGRGQKRLFGWSNKAEKADPLKSSHGGQIRQSRKRM